MHGHDFLVDVDVKAPGEVNSPSTLSVDIKDGMQINNLNTIGANRLLIFTGTAVNRDLIGHDDNLARGVFRVRLRFPVPQSVLFKASATLAALSSVHGDSDEDLTFAADAAVTVTDPTDGRTLPANGLPDHELYAIIDTAYQGNGSRLTCISYQANVLVQDTEPDLESILLRFAGSGPFVPSLNITVDGVHPVFWDFQLSLTGPVPQDPQHPTFNVVVESSDLVNVPTAFLATISEGNASAIFPNNFVLGTCPVEAVTLTATAASTGTIKTATLIIGHLT